MNKKKLTTKLLVAALLVFSTVSAETVTRVTVETDTTDMFTMYDSGKMYFSGNYLVLDTIGNGPTAMKPMKTINKIMFETVEISSSGVEKILSSAPSLSVHPNPVLDDAMIEADIDGDFDFSVFNSNGQIVLNGYTKSGAAIQLSSLAKGVYFLKVKNTIVKIIKL